MRRQVGQRKRITYTHVRVEDEGFNPVVFAHVMASQRYRRMPDPPYEAKNNDADDISIGRNERGLDKPSPPHFLASDKKDHDNYIDEEGWDDFPPLNGAFKRVDSGRSLDQI